MTSTTICRRANVIISASADPTVRQDYWFHAKTPSLRSVAQQFVDRGFRARLGVDALDDHRAIERRTLRPVGERLARQRSGDDHRIGRHFADEGLAGRAVDDLGRGRSEDHTSELQSLMRTSYAVFCLKKK